jgi:hypothetical protein
MLISGTGCVEPVPIALKSDRSGLGRDAALKQIAAEKLAIRNRLARQREKATDTQDYRARLARKAAERQIEGDLRKSQRVCEQLDTSKVHISWTASVQQMFTLFNIFYSVFADKGECSWHSWQELHASTTRFPRDKYRSIKTIKSTYLYYSSSCQEVTVTFNIIREHILQ